MLEWFRRNDFSREGVWYSNSESDPPIQNALYWKPAVFGCLVGCQTGESVMTMLDYAFIFFEQSIRFDIKYQQ